MSALRHCAHQKRHHIFTCSQNFPDSAEQVCFVLFQFYILYIDIHSSEVPYTGAIFYHHLFYNFHVESFFIDLRSFLSFRHSCIQLTSRYANIFCIPPSCLLLLSTFRFCIPWSRRSLHLMFILRFSFVYLKLL